MADQVDPRFDPAFQRGFDPSKHRTKLKPQAPVEERREATRLETSLPPVEERREATRLETSPDDANPDDANPDDDNLDPDPPRRNPFRLALLLFSLAAIAGAGLVLWKRIVSDPYGGYGGLGGDVFKIFLDQFADAALTPLLTGGLLGLCLWFALGALRRRDDA